jgi:hypothetical protein
LESEKARGKMSTDARRPSTVLPRLNAVEAVGIYLAVIYWATWSPFFFATFGGKSGAKATHASLAGARLAKPKTNAYGG